MELVKATKLNLNNGSKDILIDTDFRILEGQKIGLIGPNGVGKTTLIRLLLGETEQDNGSLFLKKDLNVGYLPQQPKFDSEMPLQDFLITELTPIMDKLHKLESSMVDTNPETMEALLTDYQKVSEQFETLGGYSALDKGEALLKKLGLDNSLDQSMGSLSGGERSLVFFAKALISEPELLILDEPGNHLDYLGLAWLESFIQGYKSAVLIVSHNRYLLDKTCETLFDMFNGKLTTFNGKYSSLRLEKYRHAIIEKSAYESSKKEIVRIKRKLKELQSIAMSQNNPPAKIMDQLSANKKKLQFELDKNLERPQIENDNIKLNFGEENSKSHIAMEVKDFSFSYDDKVLFKNAALDIQCREKVALVGPNGVGKTTFINVVLNHGDWNNKGLRIGPSQKVGYLSQVPSFDSSAITITDEIRCWGPLTADEAFNIAKKFSFEFQDMDKHLSVLSGGEVNRLQLARLMYQNTNFLILDEPTNHMDINSREMIEQAINNFSGTVLVISHDRFFLDQLVDRVIEISDKKFTSFDGNFSEYFKFRYPVLPRLNGEIKTRGTERSIKVKTVNSIDIEKRIENAEEEKMQLEQELKSLLNSNDHQKGRKVATKLEKLEVRLEKLYKDWEKIT
ncbi:MAG: ABC-F family ATP-binding cassette domain-containing protein [Spirochaetaceae bacterium]